MRVTRDCRPTGILLSSFIVAHHRRQHAEQVLTALRCPEDGITLMDKCRQSASVSQSTFFDCITRLSAAF
jgi:hypothetical protein